MSIALAWALASSPARPETLLDAWQAALASDATLSAAHERVAAADALYSAARAERLPAINASSMVTRWDTAPAFDFSAAGVPAQLALFGGRNMTMSEASVSVPIYTGGRIRAGVDAAAAAVSARHADAAALSLDVKLLVAEHYVAVLRAQSIRAVAASNASSLAAHASDAEDMYRSGQVPRNDFLAAAVSLADARQQELQAESSLAVAEAAFNRSLGRNLDTPVTVEAVFPDLDPVLASSSVAELTSIALANRRDVESLSATATALTAQSTALRGATRPQLVVNGGYVSLDNDFLNRDDFWSVGVGMRWNLFDSGRTRNSAAALAHQAAAIARERANLMSVVEMQVKQAWLNRNAARERIGATEAAVEQAEENLRVVRDRYRNGEGTNTDVLTGETLRSVSRGNFDRARFDATLAELRLARAVGVL